MVFNLTLWTLNSLKKPMKFFSELNAFGAEFSAASCLFHWLRDNSILENHNDKNDQQEVFFRVLSSNITTKSVEEIERVPPIFHF